MSEQGIYGGRLIDRIIDEEVIEHLYADNEATSVELTTVQEDTIPSGYEGIIVSIAVSSNDTIVVYLKRDGKQYYENGLNCGGLSRIGEEESEVYGVGDEVPLLIRMKEKGKWELQFKASAGTPQISWRLRVRHFKKGA